MCLSTRKKKKKKRVNLEPRRPMAARVTSFDYNCVICHYSPKYDLYITLCCQSVRENIPATCRMEERKLVHAFTRITSRNTSFFQQQDKHRILLTLATSSTGFT